MSELSENDLFHLLELFTNSDMSVLHVRSADFEVFLSRTEDAPGLGYPAQEPVAGHGSAVPAATPAGTALTPEVGEPDPNESDEGSSRVSGAFGDTVVVPAPSVGSFYRSPRPDLPAYVDVGSAVEPDTTVGLIEAMKVFTAVSGGASGVIEEILVADNEFVEYGQPLMRISPASGSTGR